MKFAKIFIVILLSVSFPFPVFAQEEKSPTVEDIMKLLYRDFKEIQSFGFIHVQVEGDNAQKIGLNQSELTDYVKLRFKNNFAKIKYEDASKKMLTLFQNESEAKKVGYLGFRVWVVGADYPIAYYVECKAGHFKNFSIWSDAVLGYGSKMNVPDTIKKALDGMVERLAIDFFKVRGEM